MEIIPKCVGVAIVDPDPSRKVILSFAKDHTQYRMSGEEAFNLAKRLLEVAREVGAAQ